MRSEKGITIVSLVITVVVLTIIVGITLVSGIDPNEDLEKMKSTVLKSELAQVQQIVLETYIKYKQTDNTNLLIGSCKDNYDVKEQIILYISAYGNYSELENMKQYVLDHITNTNKIESYYEINSDNLEELGISGSNEKYLINYYTGEVLNISTIVINGELLYKGAINE